MLPYNASDMIRAMHHDHGLSPKPETETDDQNAIARIRQGDAPVPPRFRRWIGAVATYFTFL